jgi:hypothetical protein
VQILFAGPKNIKNLFENRQTFPWLKNQQFSDWRLLHAAISKNYCNSRGYKAFERGRGEVCVQTLFVGQKI